MTTTATRLSDVIEPAVYMSYTAVDNPETTALFQSGIVTRNAVLDEKARTGGKTVDLPFWNDLDPTVEPNYSTDDPDVAAGTGKVDAAEMVARIAYLNKGYCTTDLTGEIAGSNPMQRIRNRFGTYWARQWQRRVIAAAKGVLAKNIATNSGDMVRDASIADGNAATSANLFSRSNFTAAAFTMGDAVDGIQAIAVHSVVFKRMVDNDDIDFIPDSKGALTVPTFMGKRVVVDDSMPVVAGGTSGFVYTSVLFGAGAFGYGEGTPLNPVEVLRDPKAGNGGGAEFLFERNTWLLHPTGHKFLSATMNGGTSANLADLALAANWSRVVVRKNVPLAFLKTNG
jgi:hypothetical protein